MRIVVDLQGAQTGSRFRGIGRYSLAIAKALIRQANHHDIWVVANQGLSGPPEYFQSELDISPDRIKYFACANAVSWHDMANSWRREAMEISRESFIQRLQPDSVFVSSLFEGGLDDAVLSIGRLSTAHKTSAVLYDLIPFTDPAKYLPSHWSRAWYDEKVADLQRADMLFSISNYSTTEAQRLLGLPSDRITTISAAVDSKFRKLPPGDSGLLTIRYRHGIEDKFIFCTGAMDERKNLSRLIEAYARLPRSIIGSYQLALAGKWNSSEADQIRSIAEKLQIAGRVLVLDHVSDDDLVLLLNAASLFVFPSLIEGFGLPPLEAMACGTATIASNTTSLPEVVGWSEALFDPTDVLAISAAMERALSDRGFHDALREHATNQASKFSWSRSADIVLNALDRLHADGSGKTHATFQPKWSRALENWRHESGALVARVAAISTTVRPSTNDLQQLARVIATDNESTRWMLCETQASSTDQWRLEGPFDSSYSLALVNRELARAIDDSGFSVVLHSTEGPGDFAPNPDFLEHNPEIQRLHEREPLYPPEDCVICSRNLFPPRVADMHSRINLLHAYGWEESGFPAEWIDDFNENLQGVACVSEHVRKTLVDNGLRVPAWVVGAGTDHWEHIRATANFSAPGSGFRFLHVSSCFPRKGADILLQAYGDAFSINDDVCLIIKTFANPHNRIHDWLREARAEKPDFPQVIVIEQDLSDEELKALYLSCDCLVAPSKAEGFGLPLAEAMLCGMEVIVTGWSGQLDFCTDQTAWILDYDFESANSHLGAFDSVWARPSRRHLAALMKDVRSLTGEERGRRSRHGRLLLEERFQWKHVADRMKTGALRIASGISRFEPRVGWISTWNTRCGIATYSAHLVGHMPSSVAILAPDAQELTEEDTANVVRCWDQYASPNLSRLQGQIDKLDLDTLVIQFNYGFFDFDQLTAFIAHQVDQRGRRIVVVLHSTQDPPDAQAQNKELRTLVEALRKCQRVIVHSVNDLNRLKALGVASNTLLFPHGLLDHHPTKKTSPASSLFTISTYGFCLPHKGLPEIVQAFSLLRKKGVPAQLKLINAEYPAEPSRQLLLELRKLVAELGLKKVVEFHSSFLSDSESLSLLDQSDLVVFPYQNTGESASGAVRYGLASRRPVAVTPISIFDDLAQAVHRLPGASVADLASGLEDLVTRIKSGDDRMATIERQASRWVDAHVYSKLGHRFSNLLFGLRNE